MGKFNSAYKLLAMAQRYAQQNPDTVRRVTDKAARFADDRTQGRYRQQIDTAVRKVDEVSGTGRQRNPNPNAGPNRDSADRDRRDPGHT